MAGGQQCCKVYSLMVALEVFRLNSGRNRTARTKPKIRNSNKENHKHQQNMQPAHQGSKSQAGSDKKNLVASLPNQAQTNVNSNT